MNRPPCDTKFAIPCAVASGIAVWVCLAGCAPRPPTGRVVCWAAADGVEARPATVGGMPAPRSGGATVHGLGDAADRIELTAALNETVAFRFWIAYAGEVSGSIDVAVDDWRSGDTVLSAEGVTLYRAAEVRVPRWPGWHVREIPPTLRREIVEDVLIPADAPRGGLPRTMSDGDVLGLWIDVHVPKGTPPGVFWSKLRVRCEGGAVDTTDLRLEVLPVVLPDRVGADLVVDVDHAALFAHHVTYGGRPCGATRIMTDSPIRMELQAVLDSTIRLLRAHRVSPLLGTLYPVVKIDAFNELTIRWDDYDRTVEGYLGGSKFVDRAPLAIWRIPFDERFPTPSEGDVARSPGDARHLRRYLAACADHFAERGWLDRSHVRVPHAASPSEAGFAALRYFTEIIRQADARLCVLSELFPQDLHPYGWPSFPTTEPRAPVDIWCSQAQFFEPRGDGAGTAQMWIRMDRPPYSGTTSLAAAPADTWVISWQAFHEGAKAVWLGRVNAWPPAGEAATAQQSLEAAREGSGAGVPLLYPGTIAGLSEPIPSVRLKRLRRGMQDLAYLELMKQKGMGHIASVLADSLARYAGTGAYRYHYADVRRSGWARNARVWRLARAILIDELTAVVRRGVVEREAKAAANVRWGQLIEAVRRVEIEIAEMRVRRHTPMAGGPATVECTASVRNGTRRPVSGSIGFGALPAGWAGSAAEVQAAPGRVSTVVLTASAPAVTWEEGGVREVPVRFTTNDGRTYEIAARLSYVSAQPVSGAIRVDGNLSDWPPSVSNLASEFALISGERAALPEPDQARPSSATRVYAAADAEALYFAFDCATDGPAPAWAGHDNVLAYEDLIPIGGEMVEIVIDPTAAGTHSTSDLYHVVIRPTGAFWERGVGTQPPTGDHGVWAADVRYATRVDPDRWTAEVRIPLSSFNGSRRGVRRGEVWAVNFSRFDQSAQEYSNWAGAVRNFYDPASLGNLALP